VDFVVEKVKHGYGAEMPKLLIRFSSKQEIRGFRVDYSITEKSLPEAVEGFIDTRIEGL
jgi:hypothetical protein